MVFRDPTGVEGNVLAYVSAVDKDTHLNSSSSPSNADINLYTVYYRQPATGQWMSLCPVDPYGDAKAMAVPLDPTDWSAPSRAKFGFACTATGVAAKCARNWGYKPWVSSPVDLAPYYRACLVAARADYCQEDHSFTRDGTLVDLFDFDGVNPTVGLPFAPNSTGVMLHEEYQVSVNSHAKDLLTDSQYKNLSLSDQALVTRLLRSGLESSRYPDLDPGRSCAAAPYIDRCDPEEPYTCYRETNLASQSYGPMLALNSPRHCAHSDGATGDPLDPLCNSCTSRVCELDPTCCGDPGIDVLSARARLGPALRRSPEAGLSQQPRRRDLAGGQGGRPARHDPARHPAGRDRVVRRVRHRGRHHLRRRLGLRSGLPVGVEPGAV